MDRISITCTVRAVDEIVKDRTTGEKDKVGFTVEAKVESFEKDEDRIALKGSATMLATGNTLEEAQRKAIDLAKKEIGL